MAKAMKVKRVLFFLAGGTPSVEELAEASEFEGKDFVLCFRNASKVEPDGSIETFDIVAGLVPDAYRIAADAKGDEVPGPMPLVPAASVPAGSPLAAPEGGDAGSKPKAPAPGATKPWTPNA